MNNGSPPSALPNSPQPNPLPLHDSQIHQNKSLTLQNHLNGPIDPCCQNKLTSNNNSSIHVPPTNTATDELIASTTKTTTITTTTTSTNLMNYHDAGDYDWPSTQQTTQISLPQPLPLPPPPPPPQPSTSASSSFVDANYAAHDINKDIPDTKRSSITSSSIARRGSHRKQRAIVRKFQKFDPSELISEPAPNVKIGQRVAYKEYYGNEFGTIRWIGKS